MRDGRRKRVIAVRLDPGTQPTAGEEDRCRHRQRDRRPTDQKERQRAAVRGGAEREEPCDEQGDAGPDGADHGRGLPPTAIAVAAISLDQLLVDPLTSGAWHQLGVALEPPIQVEPGPLLGGTLGAGYRCRSGPWRCPIRTASSK